MKVWRRLQRIGAVALKSSVYVLPYTAEASEDFQWVRREVVAAGGEASVCQAAFLDGLSDAQVEALFRAQRDAEYAEFTARAEELGGDRGGRDAPSGREVAGELARLERRFGEIVAADHFGAAGRRAATEALARAQARLRRPAARPRPGSPTGARPSRGHTWVTRSGVHVDRIASAWLIRGFIDPEARFRFAAPEDDQPRGGEQRFDMFAGDFTHEGDRCTFETLVDRFGLAEPALAAIGEVVHDIDCKDGKFGRAETAGVERVIAGIVRREASDDARLARGAALFDELYEAFGGGARRSRAAPPRDR